MNLNPSGRPRGKTRPGFNGKRMRGASMKKSILLILILPVFLSAGIFEYEEPFNGARPLGMGGAFTGVSDDSSAVSYNPAGLAQIKYSQAGWTYSPAYLPGFFRSYAHFVLPVARFSVIGIDWHHTGYQDMETGAYGVPELAYSEGVINAGIGTRLLENLYGGATLKVLYVTADLDGESMGKGAGFNMNMGLLYQLSARLRIGLSGHNLLPSFTDTKKWGATIRYENGIENLKYAPSVRLGIGLIPLKNLLVALDLGDPVSFGAEYWPVHFFGIRTGARYSMLNPDFTVSGGASLRYWIGQLDYALIYNPGLSITHNFGFSALWGYQAYLIDVVSVDMQGIFPSIYKTYAQKDVLRIKLKNKSGRPLDAKVGFEAEKIMRTPTEKRIVLKPNVLTEVTLPVVFSHDITETKDDSVVSGSVTLSYRVDERESKDVNSQKFTLYSRNALVWDDMDKIASFVTPQDEKVIEFTRDVLQNNRTTGSYVASRNFHRAMLLFQALGVSGITYVPDPSNPFGTSSEVIDYIQYPRETLKARTGDCDDCTVLYASCLESIGIRTACVITPDHILLMFDSGILPEEVSGHFQDQELYLVIDGAVWVPVEATMFGKPFFNAVREGIASCQKALQSPSPGAIHVVDIQTAWGKYPSSAVKAKDFSLTVPDIRSMKNLLFTDAVTYIGIREGAAFTGLLDQIKAAPKDAKLQNQAGRTFGMYGLFDLSRAYFEEASRLDPSWASPHNNLGNLYLLIELYDKALSEYETALKLSPGDSMILENINFAKKLKNK